MKKLITLILVLVMCLSLCACGHQHTWKDATCTEPKTCTECGETEGSALGHSWRDAICTEPKTCTRCGATEGSALGHSWKDAICTEPKTCTRCGATEGSALGHLWKDATCTEPKTCTRCGKTEGLALGHSWIAQTQTTPKMCKKCGKMEPMPLPQTGTVFLGNDLSKGSEITIKASDELAYIKLKNAKKEDVFAFFVRANTTTTVDIPVGNFYVYFACGDEWFGTEYYFGDKTSFFKDSQLRDFSKYTITYTLYKVTNGNFKETPISKDEFD